MAILQSSFCRLSLSNAFIPFKSMCFARLSTTPPLSKISVEEKLGFKPRPKRPKSTFLRFLSQIKPQILQDKPSASVIEINRIAGERWRAADEKIKVELSEEYKVDWVKYLDQLKAYNKTLSPTQKEEILKATTTLTVNKKKKKLKQKMEQMGKPKKPPSTFVYFLQTKISERGETPFREWQKLITKEWESLPASFKEELNHKYQKELEKYKSSLEKWENKMKKEGHQELVRRPRS